jgi:hypothetical protein
MTMTTKLARSMVLELEGPPQQAREKTGKTVRPIPSA